MLHEAKFCNMSCITMLYKKQPQGNSWHGSHSVLSTSLHIIKIFFENNDEIREKNRRNEMKNVGESGDADNNLLWGMRTIISLPRPYNDHFVGRRLSDCPT